MIGFFARNLFPFVALASFPLEKQNDFECNQPKHELAMASDAENILDQFEAALTGVLEAFHSEDGAPYRADKTCRFVGMTGISKKIP